MASKDIKGITIEINGDTTDLQKALQKPQGDAQSLQKELREINNSLKFNPDSLELLAQKSTVLGQEIAAVSEKLKILKESQSQVADQAAKGQIGEEQYREFNREVEKTADQLNSLKLQLADNGREITRVGEETGAAAKSSQAFQRAVEEQKKAVDKAKDSSAEHGKAIRSLKDDYNDAEKGALTFGDAVKASTLGNLFAEGIQHAASALWDFANAGAESARQLEVNERKLELVLKNTVNATDGYIESVKELIDKEEQLGVVSGHAQTAAAAELATYVTKRGTVEKLLPVLNDMIAFQSGVNASQQEAISIATGLGKALDGQVGSLQRWGYRFSEAEQEIIKTGTESQKLKVIIDNVTDSVGGLSYGLRETTEEGRLFGATLDLQQKQRDFGKNIEKIKTSLLISLLPAFEETIGVINEYLIENSDLLINLGGVLSAVITTFNNFLKVISSIPAPVLALVAGIALAVKTFTAASAGLNALNGVLKLANLSFSSTTIKILALVAAVSVLLYLILALKEGTRNASKALEGLGNVASDATNAAQPRNINAYASGTRSAARGWALVGEEGPELVRFTGGEQVFTAAQSRQLATAGAYNTIPTQYTYIDQKRQYFPSIERYEQATRAYELSDFHAWKR